jgi:hypothetical protein
MKTKDVRISIPSVAGAIRRLRKNPTNKNVAILLFALGLTWSDVYPTESVCELCGKSDELENHISYCEAN